MVLLEAGEALEHDQLHVVIALGVEQLGVCRGRLYIYILQIAVGRRMKMKPNPEAKNNRLGSSYLQALFMSNKAIIE